MSIDVKVFADDNFDPITWINSTFSTDADANNGISMMNAIMQLQIHIQEVSANVDGATGQVLISLPRMLRDLESICSDSKLLKDQINLVKREIEQIGNKTDASMQLLGDLDSIKSRLKSASSALQESDNFSTLLSEVETAFANDETALEISNKIMAMQHSLQSLSHVADFEQRSAKLDDVRNKLESMVSAQLVSALSQRDFNLLKNYSKVFANIDRMQVFERYYLHCKKQQYLTEWKQIIARKSINGQCLLTPYCDALDEFCDILLSNVQAELRSCAEVFSDTRSVFLRLVNEVFIDFKPSPMEVFQQSQNDMETDAIELCSRVLQTQQHFTDGLSQSFTDSANRLQPTRFSIPFVAALLSKYDTILRGWFNTQYESLLSAGDDSIEKQVKCLNETMLKFENIITRSLSHIETFGNYILIPDWLIVVGEAMGRFFADVSRLTTNIRERMLYKVKDDRVVSHMELIVDVITAVGRFINYIFELEHELYAQLTKKFPNFWAKERSELEQLCNICMRDCLLIGDGGNIDICVPFVNKIAELLILLKASEQPSNIIFHIQIPVSIGQPQPSVFSMTEKLGAFSIAFAYEVILELNFTRHLKAFSAMDCWSMDADTLTTDLPQFSLTPRDYISTIGQNLLLSIQQLDVLFQSDNSYLNLMFEKFPLPHCTVPQRATSGSGIVEMWLEALANGFMQRYSDCIFQLKFLSSIGAKQLLVDVNYLFGVLEDIDVRPVQRLADIRELLQAYVDGGQNRFRIESKLTKADIVGGLAKILSISL